MGNQKLPNYGSIYVSLGALELPIFSFFPPKYWIFKKSQLIGSIRWETNPIFKFKLSSFRYFWLSLDESVSQLVTLHFYIDGLEVEHLVKKLLYFKLTFYSTSSFSKFWNKAVLLTIEKL